MIEATVRVWTVGFPALGALVVFDEVQSVIGPCNEAAVVYRDFDPRFAEIARQVAGLISRHLPSLRVEHVGSTAVPDCGGRGIVDLLIACPEGEMEKVHSLLERLGFRPGGDVVLPPHAPALRGVLDYNGDAFPLHVYVLSAGADQADSMRFLRSCLRSDAELARAYVQHKRAIVAKGVREESEYNRQKAEFLKMVLG
jgi:GrpB-like predicted nucleotidyltransferase (UPF0157 family)